MALEASTTVSDHVTAEMVDCQPEGSLSESSMVVVGALLEASPVERAAEATIEQTGAGPPPDEDMR